MLTNPANRFLDQVASDHTPTPQSRSYFLKAAEAAAARGVFLELSDFQELQAINAANMVNWRPLHTSFRIDTGGVLERPGFVVVGRDRAGQVVCTQAGKLMDWSQSNLKREAESLRCFYSDPSIQAASGETCVVTAPNAEDITGSVVFLGAVWYHPSMRGRQLARIVPRIGRVLSLSRWNVDSVCGVIADANNVRDFDKRLGYSEVTRHVIHTNSPSYPNATTLYVLCRMQREEIITDSAAFVRNFNVDFDERARDRSA